jgi:hypothetical protein
MSTAPKGPTAPVDPARTGPLPSKLAISVKVAEAKGEVARSQ